MDDLGHKLVEVVELVHEEGVLLVWVSGDVLQLVLGRPGDADGVGDHFCTRETKGGLNTRALTRLHHIKRTLFGRRAPEETTRDKSVC